MAILPFEDKAKYEKVEPEALLDELYRQMEATEAFDILEKEKSKAISAERSAREIGETLNVGAIVKGELSQRGNVIRVEAQLIECASGSILAEAATELQVRGKGYIKPAGGTDKIVVVHVNGWLFTLNIDGSNKRMLAKQLNANPKDRCEQPVVSPDGRKIAFIQNKKVWVINSNGSQLSLLGYEGYGGWPPWTYQKDEIILRSKDGAVSIVDINGVKPPKRLEGIFRILPEPGGSAYILVTPITNDLVDLYIADTDLANRKLLIKNVHAAGILYSQVLLPDGAKITYLSNDEKTFLIDRDGGNRKELAKKAAIVKWSPDGSKIAFVFEGDDNIAVLNIADADGSNRKVLTSSTHLYNDMAFSPDGSRIAFWVKNRNNELWDLHSVNIEDSSDTILSRRWYEAGTLYWSSDGTKLIFMAKPTKDSNYNLYSVDADGSNEKELIRNVQFYFEVFQYPFEYPEEKLTPEEQEEKDDEELSGNYFPIEVGNWWKWINPDEPKDTGVIVITETTQLKDGRTVFVADEIGGGEVYFSRTANDMILLHQTLDQLQGVLVYRPPLKVGAEWQAIIRSENDNLNISVKVVAQEDIRTPAGIFRDCYRLEVQGLIDEDDFLGSSLWLAKDIGPVKLTFALLVVHFISPYRV